MDILMPQLGETVAEGKITKWFKAAGDAVKPGDNLFEIETDKTSMEVPATSEGVLSEIRVREGDVVPVGAVVAVISGAASSAAPAAPASAPRDKASPTPIATSAPAPARAAPQAPVKLDPFHEVRSPERNFGPARLAGGTVVTPLARRLATEVRHRPRCDLSIRPARPHQARDVEALMRTASTSRPAVAKPVGDADRVIALYEPGSFEEVPLDNMRRIIATRLIEAKQTIPHFYLSVDAAIERLIEVREETNVTAAKGEDGQPAFRLSLNDFVIKALALALQRVPAANAVWAHDRILRFWHADVGVAVAIGRRADHPGHPQSRNQDACIEISAEVKDLAARARARRLKPHEFQGGASAVSNLGMYGVREFAAIINPPHATILAVGAGERRPVETADGFRFVSQMTVTLSCDHRVVDGALGAKLLATFKSLIEHPVGLLI